MYNFALSVRPLTSTVEHQAILCGALQALLEQGGAAPVISIQGIQLATVCCCATVQLHCSGKKANQCNYWNTAHSINFLQQLQTAVC